jgi:hypothetical protein
MSSSHQNNIDVATSSNNKRKNEDDTTRASSPQSTFGTFCAMIGCSAPQIVTNLPHSFEYDYNDIITVLVGEN